MQKRGPDYGAMIIQGTAAVVIAISLFLILLVVGNMIYTSFTEKVALRERVRSFFRLSPSSCFFFLLKKAAK